MTIASLVNCIHLNFFQYTVFNEMKREEKEREGLPM